MLTAQDYIDHVRDTLFDPAPGAAWSDKELIRYLNLAMTAIVALKPNARPISTTLALDPGVDQVLPDNAVIFMDAFRTKGGSAVTVQSLHEVSRTQDFTSINSSDTVEYVFFDPRIPTHFRVFPPADSGTTMSMLYGALPTRVTAGTVDNELTLSDIYETAIWAYMVGMANAKQSKRQSPDLFKLYMEFFAGQIASIMKNEATMGAKVDIRGEG